MEKGIWQLKKLVLHYSTSDHSSKGMRDFILGITSSQVGSSGGLQSPLSLAAFALANPQLAIDAKAHANRAPRVVGEPALADQGEDLARGSPVMSVIHVFDVTACRVRPVA